MKRIISIVAILFCFTISYGQDTKPTKQETIDWIVGKFTKYPTGMREQKIDNDTYKSNSHSKIVFTKYSNGVLYFEETRIEFMKFKNSDDPIEKINSITYYKIDINQLTNVILSPDGSIILNGGKINEFKTITESDDGNFIVNGKKYVVNNDWSFNSSLVLFYPQDDNGNSGYFIDFNSETNLKDRMIKALTVFATFNKESLPKEKF